MKKIHLIYALSFILLAANSCKKEENPIADFELSSSSFTVPCEVTFTNKSLNATEYEWNFGDEKTSTEDNPKHTYNATGTFVVKLTAKNKDKSDLATKEIIITLNNNPYSNPSAINSVFNAAPNYSNPDPYSDTEIGTTTTSIVTDSKGNKYTQKSTEHKVNQRFKSYQPIGNQVKKSGEEIYPGAIIQGKYWHTDGSLISYGDFKGRRPMTITIDGIQGLASKTVVPSKENMKKAIDDIFANASNLNGNTKYTFSKVESHDQKQVALSLGLKKDWIVGSFGLDVDFSNNVNKHTIVIYFRQEYFTVVTDKPTMPANFFNENADIIELQQTVKNDNPAGYVTSVTYGRVLTATMTSEYQQDSMSAAVNAVFGTWNPSLRAKYDHIFQNATFTASVSGGSNSQTAITNIDQVINFINAGMSISNLSEAVPISFTVNYLDNSPFYIGDNATYYKKEYEKYEEKKNFDIFVWGYNIVADGDDWGAGDFYYDITIDWNTDQWHQDNVNSQYVNANDGEWINFNQNITPFSLPKVNDAKFSVSVKLWEENGWGTRDLVGDRTIDFAYPWNNVSNTTLLDDNGNFIDAYGINLKQSSGAEAYFYISIIPTDASKKPSKNTIIKSIINK